MKKRLGALFVFVAAMLMVTASALAGTEIIDSGYCGAEDNIKSLWWTLNTDGVLTISGTGEMGHQYTNSGIPTKYSEQILNVQISSGVTSIGFFAFDGCTNLSSVTIPSSVTTINEGAFYRCAKLANVTIPSGVTSIESYTFFECASLKNVTIPPNVTSIGVDAFAWCDGLTSMTIPSSVTNIEAQAFAKCANLRNVTIPSSVTSIHEDAFLYSPNVIIYGVSGSVAETYAKENDIPFVDMNAVPSAPMPDGVTLDNPLGKLAIYKDGELVDYTGFEKFEGADFYFEHGVIRDDMDGLTLIDGTWYNMQQGRFNTADGMVFFEGATFLVKGGVIDETQSGLIEYNGQRFVFSYGQFVSSLYGAWPDPISGRFVYIWAGQFYPITDLVSYDGQIFYFVNGYLATDFVGTVYDFNGTPFNVIYGQVY